MLRNTQLATERTERSLETPELPAPRVQRVIGRYAIYDEIASGGMAVVHFGRLAGPVGFARSVAIKRLHPQFARDPEFVAMFLDEARLAARIRHPNVVPTLDVVSQQGELYLVLEYVQGETASRLLRAAARNGERMPVPVAVSIIVGALHGLHAAHEARSERGEPLGIIHRDVSPQNILVGEDGVARIADFGVAKASWRVQSTREGQLKGKLPYMAPEQLTEQPVDRRVDVYAASVVLWELLAGRRLFAAENPAAAMKQLLSERVPPPSEIAGRPWDPLDEIVLQGLSREPEQRFESARAMAIAIEEATRMASARQVGDWVIDAGGVELRMRGEMLSAIERAGSGTGPVPILAPVADTIRVEVPFRGDGAPEELPAGDLATDVSNVIAESAVRTAAPPPRPLPTRSFVRAAGAGAVAVVALAAVLWVAFGRGRDARERPGLATAPPAAQNVPVESTAASPAAPVASAPAATPPATPAATAPAEAVAIDPAPPPAASAPAEAPRDKPRTRASGVERSGGAKTHAPLPSTHTDTIVRAFPDEPSTARPPSPPPASSATKADCHPPYTVDAEGVRVPKPGCF